MSSNITWIASYPKSGNTMVRTFIASYFFTNDGILKNFEPLKNINSFNNLEIFDTIDTFPNINLFINKPEEIAKYWQEAQININNFNDKVIFLKTHNAQINYRSNFFTNADLTKCFIYVVRDPRSVLLSSMSHFGFIKQEEAKNQIFSDKRLTYANLEKKLPEFLLSWRTNFISWHNFGKENPELGLIIKYEDLILNKEKTFLIILIFLLKKFKKKINMIKFKNSLESINFQKLKKLEKNIGFDEKSKKASSFFRKGIIDEWKNKLDKKIIKEINQKFNYEMKYLGYL